QKLIVIFIKDLEAGNNYYRYPQCFLLFRGHRNRQAHARVLILGSRRSRSRRIIQIRSHRSMRDKLDELRRRAEEAARGINEKYDIKSKLDQGARVASDAVRKGAEVASSGLDAVRQEASRIDREYKVTETVTETARRASNAAEKTAKRAASAVDEAA